jgi:hypothetical protein
MLLGKTGVERFTSSRLLGRRLSLLLVVWHHAEQLSLEMIGGAQRNLDVGDLARM